MDKTKNNQDSTNILATKQPSQEQSQEPSQEQSQEPSQEQSQEQSQELSQQQKELQQKYQMQQRRLMHMIKMIQRQTNYDEETIKEKLKQWNYNYIAVIKDYLNPDFQKKKAQPEIPTTKNQMIYGEIRNFMDDVNKQQILRKRRAEQMEKQREYLELLNAKK